MWGIPPSDFLRRSCTGSPPPVWGIRAHCRRPGSRRTVHPHLCGEYGRGHHPPVHIPGSPPPVWGIRPPGVGVVDQHRFTPTCVGNTTINGIGTRERSVHPHLCGEYGCPRCNAPSVLGSPPPVWGIRIDVKGRRSPFRFTPTCVGNTVLDAPHHSIQPVHPHLCGEYGLRQGFALRSTGSPPPVWGIRIYIDRYPGRVRFTPTCVGNTSFSAFILKDTTVHPHLCGEYAFSLSSTWTLGGSPPPVWGILETDEEREKRLRFTPTCVGNTHVHRSGLCGHPVHPHLCGEYRRTFPLK